MISVVGVGLEGAPSLTPRGRRLVAEAEVLVGTDRHLALIDDGSAARVRWHGSLAELEPLLRDHEHERTVLLASGDPNLFGVGATLRERLGRSGVDVEPSVSSLQLALARAAVPMAGTALLSAHGRSLDAAAGQASRQRRAAILTDSRRDPAAVSQSLRRFGVEDSARLVVCEQLGGAGERIREGTVGSPPPGPFDALSVVVVDRDAAPGPGVGRPEADYEHDGGQVTKAEVRAITVAALDPGPEDVVWDLGAGSASVAVEAAGLAVRGAVYAVERRPDRAERARRNAARSWNIEVLVGEAAALAATLPSPDAVFVGGGGPDLAALLVTCLRRLAERRSPIAGRLVVNLASVESVLEAATAVRSRGVEFHISQLSVARGRDLGGRLGWEALNPVHVLTARVSR